MFDIMFMHQKRNEQQRDSFESRPHGPFIPLGSTSNCAARASSLQQMHLLADETVTRALNSAVRSSVKRLHSCFKLVRAKQEKHCLATRQSGRLFSLHIAIIYYGFTVVTLTAPWYCGIGIVLNFITAVGLMVYNYSMYLWLSYSMCAFILNVFRLLFFIQPQIRNSGTVWTTQIKKESSDS